MNTFTPEKWKDLARGCRVLAAQDEEQRKKNEKTTVEGVFIKSRELHLEMAQQCEENAKLVR